MRGTRRSFFYGAVAHLGERFNGIEEVASSILASSTNSIMWWFSLVKRPMCLLVSKSRSDL